MRIYWGVVNRAGDIEVSGVNEVGARTAAKSLAERFPDGGYRLACFADLGEVAYQVEQLASEVPVMLSPREAIRAVALALGVAANGTRTMEHVLAMIQSRMEPVS